MTPINGYDPNTRERVWTDDAQSNRAFMQEVRESKAGKTYFKNYASRENHEKVIAAVWTLYPNIECVTVSAFVDAIGTLLAAGELVPVQVPEVPAPVLAQIPVVDRNGRILTEAQIRWSEYTKFATEHSSGDRKERARTDPGFAAFVRTSLRQEMNQEIDGDVRPFNPTNPLLNTQSPPSQAALNDARLVSFADRWRGMSMAEIRSARSRAINPLTAQKFIDDEAQAMKLGLL